MMKELSLEYLEGRIDYDTYPAELKKTRDLLDDIYKRNLYLRENKDVDQESEEFQNYVKQTTSVFLLGFLAVLDLLEYTPLLTFINKRSGTKVDFELKDRGTKTYYCNIKNQDKDYRDTFMGILDAIEILLRIVFTAIRLGKDLGGRIKIAKELATYNGYKE